MPLDNTVSQTLSDQPQGVFQAYSALGTDEKLALLYYIYEKMGKSITPAAPGAADPELVTTLIGESIELSGEDQLAIMREIVNCENTEYSRRYGALGANNQLLVWYAWAQEMGKTVIDMPADYQASGAVTNVLSQVEGLEFQQQISILREMASRMGYSDIQPVQSQAETGKTSSL